MYYIFKKGKIELVSTQVYYDTPIYKEQFFCGNYTLSLIFRGISFEGDDETPCFEIGLLIKRKNKKRFFILRDFKNYNSCIEYFEGWTKTIRSKFSDLKV